MSHSQSTSKPFRRFHPYRRPLILHSVFQPERPIVMQSPSLHIVYSLEHDASSSPPPLPLLGAEVEGSPTTYFNVKATKVSKEKIPKPAGEVGHPSRGGYSLEKALGWPTKIYKQVQVGIVLIFSTSNLLIPFSPQFTSLLLTHSPLVPIPNNQMRPSAVFTQRCYYYYFSILKMTAHGN